MRGIQRDFSRWSYAIHSCRLILLETGRITQVMARTNMCGIIARETIAWTNMAAGSAMLGNDLSIVYVSWDQQTAALT